MKEFNVKPELQRALAILASNPADVNANVHAAVYYTQNNQHKKAITHLKNALARDRKNTQILGKLSKVLIQTNQAPQARKYIRKALEIDKRDVDAIHTMAQVYQVMGDTMKAMQWIERALELEPENEEMLFDKAKILSESGEVAKSLDIHNKILELNPNAPHSWWAVAQLQKHEGENATIAIKNIESAIASNNTNEGLSRLHYSAGKIEQDIGNHARAFNHFEKANQLHQQNISADRIIAININIRETYSKELFQSLAKCGNRSHKPIFILGQSRSGTTLTESLCASHSKISAGGELNHFADFNNKLKIESTFEKRHHDQMHGLSAGDIRAIANDFISRTRRITAQGTRLTDKMPHNFLYIGLISIVFPNAQIIHCRRHPLDNCLSIYSNPMLDYHKEYKSKLDILGEYYRNYMQIMEYWNEVCPVPIHDVYYEDLVTNTEAVARRMIDHLGLEWEDGVMDRSGSQTVVNTLSIWQVRQPIFQSSKGKWRNYEEQLAPLRNAVGTYIEEYERELSVQDSKSN